jgi:hypothetical protein
MLAAQAAISKQGAIYSQGGYLAADPVNPATGDYYPRTGPDSFDCSGLVWWSYHQAGISLGWTAAQQANDGQQIPCSLADLNRGSTSCWAPGDLIFLWYDGGQHVAIYVGDGLFMDCYNHASGCILHDPSQNSFYLSHFWQARRVVSGCEGEPLAPGEPGTPDGVSPLEYPRFAAIPDLVEYVYLALPQCKDCAPDGKTPIIQREIPPAFPNSPADWISEGPMGFPILNPVNGIVKLLTWLAWLVRDVMLQVFCLLLMVLQWVINLLVAAFNGMLYGLNMGWRFAVFAWLTLRQVLYALWGWLDIVLIVLVAIRDGFALLGAWLAALGNIVMLVIGWLTELAILLLSTMLAVIGMLGWLVGLTLGVILDILAGMGADTLPAGLDYQHGALWLLRGVLDALLESPLGFVVYIGIGFVYLQLIIWITRYFKPV